MPTNSLAKLLPPKKIRTRESKPVKPAKRAKKSVAAAAAEEAKDYKKPKAAEELLPAKNAVERWKDLWDAFGWSKSLWKSMSAVVVCQTVESLWASNLQAWSTMRQRLINMVETGASILHRRNPLPLRAEYPGRYSFPSENEIRLVISSLFAKVRSEDEKNANKIVRANISFMERQ